MIREKQCQIRFLLNRSFLASGFDLGFDRRWRRVDATLPTLILNNSLTATANSLKSLTPALAPLTTRVNPETGRRPLRPSPPPATLPHTPRNPHQGFTLLAILALLLLLAAITLTLQSRSQSQLRLLSRLTTDLHDRAAQDALTDRLRGLIADAMSSPPLLNRPVPNLRHFSHCHPGLKA